MFDYIVENSTNENMIFERNGANLTPIEIAMRSTRLTEMFKHIVDLVKTKNLLTNDSTSDKTYLLSKSVLCKAVRENKSEKLRYIFNNFAFRESNGTVFSTALPLNLETIFQDAVSSNMDCCEALKELLRFMKTSNIKKVTLNALNNNRIFLRDERILKLLIPYCGDVIFHGDVWMNIILSSQQSRFLQRMWFTMNHPDVYAQFGCVYNKVSSSNIISSLAFDRMRMFSSSEIRFLRTLYLCTNHCARLSALRLDKRLLMYLTFWGVYMYL